jgi:threonylcarbamoyladenosine tRNA methylthiotransferase MtaB
VIETKRLSVITLGCKVNQVESAAFEHALEAAGFIPAPDPDAEVEVVIVNTCTVTAKAARQSRQAVRRAVDRHPGALIAVTGCQAQADPGSIAAIDGVDLIVGHAAKDQLPELLAAGRRPAGPARHGLDLADLPPLLHRPTGHFRHRTRGFLKIQDGCDQRCAYCAVPGARGPSRSIPVGQFQAGVRELLAASHREIVLTGVHLGAYGRDLAPPTTLARALTSVIDLAAEHGARLRLSSIEPGEITPELIGLLRPGGVVCPHLHVPLQSGDDGVLRAMGRPYTAGLVRELIIGVRARVPDLGLGADFLAGLPGESEAAFQRTLDLAAELPLTYLHVFPYSRRPGTVAATMAGQVPAAVAAARARRLRDLDAGKRRAFMESSLGQVRPVLIEGRPGRKMCSGRTDNYLPLVVPGADSKIGRIVPVRLTTIRGSVLEGEPV